MIRFVGTSNDWYALKETLDRVSKLAVSTNRAVMFEGRQVTIYPERAIFDSPEKAIEFLEFRNMGA